MVFFSANPMNAEDSPQAIRSKIFVEFWFDDRNSNNCWVFPSFDEVKVIPDTNKSCFSFFFASSFLLHSVFFIKCNKCDLFNHPTNDNLSWTRHGKAHEAKQRERRKKRTARIMLLLLNATILLYIIYHGLPTSHGRWAWAVSVTGDCSAISGTCKYAHLDFAVN